MIKMNEEKYRKELSKMTKQDLIDECVSLMIELEDTKDYYKQIETNIREHRYFDSGGY